jgi:hypothetical protein
VQTYGPDLVLVDMNSDGYPDVLQPAHGTSGSNASQTIWLNAGGSLSAAWSSSISTTPSTASGATLMTLFGPPGPPGSITNVSMVGDFTG